jgi:hypothetical protein
MGQINLSRITTTASIITPPTGVDAIYNQGGVFYFLDSTGSTSSIIRTPIDGVGKTDFLTKWDDEDTIGITDISYDGVDYSSPTLAGLTDSCILVADSDGVFYNSNIMVKQIAVTVSHAEILQLYTTPKVLVPRGGVSTVLQVISAYCWIIPSTGNYSTYTRLLIYEGGNGYTHTCDALASTQQRRYRFIQNDTSSSLTQTQDDNGDITLSVLTGDPTGGQGTLVVYLTYTYYDETTIPYL